ncbi:MAG: polyprenyl diphosphate synthase [Turicibacter sp.]|nr:polyprenyl diphosphate synthase [Turicibacter sp.]
MRDFPTHVAIIMDGNGRWAKAHHLPVNAGHAKGATTLRKLVPLAEEIGLKHLTVYAFSTENWSRSLDETDGLMRLMREYLLKYINDVKKNNVRISVIGDINKLDEDLQIKIHELTDLTAEKSGMHLHIAINYGGRDEIVRAARKIINAVQTGKISAAEIDNLDEKTFEDYLDTANTPPPDLIIRTGGVVRLSNFMLWQSAYAEIYATDVLWPNFSIDDLKKAIEWYSGVERRFGAR